jgi:hypothetical protein
MGLPLVALHPREAIAATGFLVSPNRSETHFRIAAGPKGGTCWIDLRVSGDDAGRVRADARELASLAPDLIVAISGDATRALKQWAAQSDPHAISRRR